MSTIQVIPYDNAWIERFEEERLSFTAYRRMATHLEIPAISITVGRHQFLQVSPAEIDEALALDGVSEDVSPRVVP
ncbi:hypothetical protein J2855_004941 [Agrobacterium tumefaciens]|uniref:Uncharacterized protein n=1 Tax=Agrobacterium tumefaciens TaxID=358 RepID=A0AAP9E7Z6_AGRTU|nr:hypothetical protein [Agrobacterium tumefaciens]MBP2511286.1 hypothetical protein [Agrobacterium tumefaciens]MBP2520655.1 hypothetical protein [Agrobacterium tumefaciens]MBP2579323.1 hypothetical protein [Agrobacterium tumefaciens]MBP2597610.1 hypothetical protein [Agrobacterium tumefaciens]MCW8060226.1 hypothetical protein [Agrobacterium tumefaciens]